MAEAKFIVDANVGRLGRWLRMMGYDAINFDGPDDGGMVRLALAQGRTIITRDREFMKRRAIAGGRVRALLVMDDDPGRQMKDVISRLSLADREPFTRCIECNAILDRREKEEVRDGVPPRVYQVQEQYMSCPACGRIYWRGTHWQAMLKRLEEFRGTLPEAAKGA